ncbi:c-type cytochrome [Marinoscillum sp.]|uniref:c-type cytochrome n=1 Tax=Marinoscillum sp. TaxID=2024838 RepID=UPI003BAD80F8
MDTRKAIGSLVQASLLLVVAILLIFGSLVLYLIDPDLFQPNKEAWHIRSIQTDLPEGQRGKQIKYGYLLTTETSRWMGPKAPEGARYAGNNLNCQSCHLEAGTKRGSASWLGVVGRFPQFRGRENKIGTIEERVNGCMERSMNGKALPIESKQMQAIVAYMTWLGKGMPEDTMEYFQGFAKLEIPGEMADLIKGAVVYANECQVCHGENGAGVWKADSSGYQYPPLWGADSYNHGAGMHRVLTAAQFIKANMPWGVATIDNPKLSDEEAYHVAAYINSFDRPMKSNTEIDFPDRKLKPMSTPYGPWADEFSAEQHKYGPFQPIASYYETTYGIKKTK